MRDEGSRMRRQNRYLISNPQSPIPNPYSLLPTSYSLLLMLSSSTIRRFTPPTCTLEIKAKNSPLSRWTNKPVFKNLRFRLSFDDPKVPEEEQVTIQGDRLQLEQLYDAVIDYVQNFLHQSFAKSNLVKKSSASNTKPYLQPQGLVSHELWLGSLANGNSTAKIQLSSVQLFDLVTALEEYQTQVAALPELDTAKSRKLLPIWGTVAATAILAVGLTTAVVKLSQQTEPDSIASSSKSPSVKTVPELNDVVPPEVPESNRITPKPQLKEPLSSTKKLPPPPPVDELKPQPDIPDPAKYPLPEVAARANIETPTSPDVSSSSNKDSDYAPPTARADRQQVESTFIIPPETQKSEPESSTIAIAPKETEVTERSSISASDGLSDDIETIETDSDPILNSPVEPTSPLPEVTRYFEEKWQPPAELKQSLEYRLFVDANGKIQKVVPIGKASEIYLDRTNIPLRREAFISPLKDKNQITVRLLLNPDGEVTVFLE